VECHGPTPAVVVQPVALRGALTRWQLYHYGCARTQPLTRWENLRMKRQRATRLYHGSARNAVIHAVTVPASMPRTNPQ
jgi:hypothetical protein